MRRAFDGDISEIPFISVDNFEKNHKSVYFLSHFHGDHIFGLSAYNFPDMLERNNGFIYGSVVTVAIVKNQYPKLTPYLKVLELGTNCVISVKEKDEDRYLNVIALPAGHSLGSIMLLFQYNKQTVLFTGDFRITQDTVSTYTHLHKNGEPIQIDAMYVDTTFQQFKSFPNRSDVVRNVAERVRDWLNLDLEHKVELITSACFGYECVCNEIYSVTGLKTYINADMWNIYRQFPKEMYGITNDDKSRVHLFTRKDGVNTDSPNILSIHFSAMKWCFPIWSPKVTDDHYIDINDKENKIEVCFATHCGRDELLYFINYFKPKRIVGFPKSFITGSTPVTPINYTNKRSWQQDEPLEFKISQRLKRKKLNSNVENLEVGRKIPNSVVRRLFDW